MAQAAQRGVRRPAFQGFFQRTALQIGPAHHARYVRVLGGQLEQKFGFLEAAPGLNGHHGVYATGCQRRRNVVGQAVLAQHGHGRVYPGQVFRLVVPIVLVGVYFHGAESGFSRGLRQ